MSRKPWSEIRAKASPEVLESADCAVTLRLQIERELREKLELLTEKGPQALVLATSDEVVSALLPWIMEIIDHARAEERIECGELP